MTTGRAEPSSGLLLLLAGIFTLLGGVVLGGWVGPGGHETPRETAEAEASDEAAAAGMATRERRGAVMPRASLIPVGLEIPAIELATPLVQLGLMRDRTVEVPSNADLAGWFHRGPTPGRPGSAVILGHVDSVDGPAVFARLQELRPGDAVSVDRADGSTVRFVVRRSVTYANADFPADRVYGAQSAPRLNLVTCGGTYDATRGGYQANLVVYTRLWRRIGDSNP